MTHLLHHAPRLELVAVRQTADQAAFALPINARKTVCLALWSAQCLALVLDRLLVLRFDFYVGLLGACAPMTGASLLRLAVEEEVAKYTTRAPEESVRPPLDTTFVLIKDEDRPRGDHLALRINKSAGDARYETAPGGLENEQRIAGGLYPPRPRRLCPGIRGGRVGGRCWGMMRVVGHAAQPG